MNRFASLLFVILIVVGTVGYCRGWFHATSTDTGGHSAVTVSVDKDKFDQDKAAVQQDVQGLGHK